MNELIVALSEICLVCIVFELTGYFLLLFFHSCLKSAMFWAMPGSWVAVAAWNHSDMCMWQNDSHLGIYYSSACGAGPVSLYPHQEEIDELESLKFSSDEWVRTRAWSFHLVADVLFFGFLLMPGFASIGHKFEDFKL